MIHHTLYRIKTQTFAGYSGAKYSVEEFNVMSNDSGNGLFRSDGSQITGNCQFWHGTDPQAVRKFFDDPYGPGEDRYFLGKAYAERYAARLNKENPIEDLPTREFRIGEIVNYCGSNCVVDGQKGRKVEIHYVNEPEHCCIAKDYELY